MQVYNRIAIIAQGAIPIVTAGAVETLLTSIVKVHEKNKECGLTVFSIYNKKAKILSAQYKNTDFVYIKVNILEKIFFKIYKKIIIDILGFKYNIKDPFTYNVYKRLKQESDKYDYVVMEHGGHLNGYKKLYKLFGDRILYHSHTNEIPQTKPLYGGIIAISNYCRKPWLKYYPEEKVKLLRNGIDLKKFKKKITQDEYCKLRRKFNIKDDDFLIIFCGRLLEVKGVFQLIEAVINIQNEHIKLLVVGGLEAMGNRDNSYVDKLYHVAAEKKDKVIFSGHINNDELYKYYQLADVQAVPSIWEEGAGLVAIEGMASGLPLIITQSGGMPEYVTEKCSVIVSKDKEIVNRLQDAIIYMYKHLDKRKTMGECGLKRACELSEIRFYDDFIKLFK